MDKYTKRSSDGSVDVAASTNAYAKALTEWSSKNDISSDVIAEAVNTVLAANAGSRVPMKALLGAAAQEIGFSPETFSAVTGRVHAYVTGQVEAGMLFVVRGTGGGVTSVRPIKKTA